MANSTELVSVYLPTRNRRPLLERAIQSVLRQSHQQIELIVVNDSSTDDTREYLEALAKNDSRLVALHQDSPAGAPAARNRAIAFARGFFITGLDDDDEFLPNRIEVFLKNWSSSQAEVRHASCLFSDSIMTDGSSSFVTTDRTPRVSYQDLFRHNFIGNQVFCPTQRLRSIGGFDESIRAWQDLETFMRLLKQHGEAVLVQEATYVCHVEPHRDRISTKPLLLRSAFEAIVKKHSDVPTRQHQLLFLQMFSPFYGVKPTFKDWKRLLKWGLRPEVIAKMARATFRNRLLR